MLIRKLADCSEITAGDRTRLRELFHPDRDYAFTGRYSLAYAVLVSGEASDRHRLASSEVYYIIKGRGEMYIGAESAPVEPGDAVEIGAGDEQWIKNTGDSDLAFLCIVDPAWRAEDEQILK